MTRPNGTITYYQAEDATISQGVVESNHLNFTGTGFVNGDNVVGSNVEFTVSGPASAVIVRYANGTTVARPMDVAVDGSVIATPAFDATANWDTWNEITIPVVLGAGSHSIRLTATTANGGPNLDRIGVSS